jgi:hypothetical protein
MSKSEWAQTTKLIIAAVRILEEQHPMTIRQLFYRLVSISMIENTKKHYQMVIRLMTTARLDGRCDFDFIVDRSRPEYKHAVWDDCSSYLNAVKRSYRKDYWALQGKYVEVWVEKDAIVGSIEPVTSELGVLIRVGRGFVSTTKTHDIAEHFRTVDKPITVFYLGDHDPSGLNIETDLEERLHAQRSGYFDFKRLAIFGSDIKKFNLPPLKIKDTDTRSSNFRVTHGNNCVELDALPPDELRRRLRNAIEGLIDAEQWSRDISVEKVEFDSIQRTVNLLKNLPKASDIARLDETIEAIREMQ